jgi:hypothetical protein
MLEMYGSIILQQIMGKQMIKLYVMKEVNVLKIFMLMDEYDSGIHLNKLNTIIDEVL